ncbi:MAG: hypothetical protein HYY16_10410 [Planctomycetes bacterium]|nr:hypothetical protein [Planctomycetota bacterium]
MKSRKRSSAAGKAARGRSATRLESVRVRAGQKAVSGEPRWGASPEAR